jgi:hypothetical protein
MWQRNLDTEDQHLIRWYGKSYDIDHKHRANELLDAYKIAKVIDEDEEPNVVFAKLGGVQCQYDDFKGDFVPITDTGKYYYKLCYEDGSTYGHFIAKDDKEMHKLNDAKFGGKYRIASEYKQVVIKAESF